MTATLDLSNQYWLKSDKLANLMRLNGFSNYNVWPQINKVNQLNKREIKMKNGSPK